MVVSIGWNLPKKNKKTPTHTYTKTTVLPTQDVTFTFPPQPPLLGGPCIRISTCKIVLEWPFITWWPWEHLLTWPSLTCYGPSHYRWSAWVAYRRDLSYLFIDGPAGVYSLETYLCIVSSGGGGDGGGWDIYVYVFFLSSLSFFLFLSPLLTLLHRLH